jgi:hypothetical protein
MALRIYLADLTHVGPGVATEAFPLNIGLIGAYSKKLYGQDVEIELFKYPQDLRDALHANPPDILGCSNYTWNKNLSCHFIGMAKTLNPQCLTVFGGTNYPFAAAEQEKFLRATPGLDLHIFYEGELAFAGIVAKMLAGGRAAVLAGPVEGCQFIGADGSFVSGQPLARIKDLDSIPSPYVTGLLDKFFDGILTPMVETARGCPFSCNYCNAGDIYFNKVNKFSDAYVAEELTYIARKAGSLGIGHVVFADNNFGMIPRDALTAELVHQLRGETNWPQTMTVWTGKNAKQRVIDVTRLLGDTLSISMSVQSMDPGVLANIKRDNIRYEDFKAISDDLDRQGRPQESEVIMPLPGESLKSHIAGLGDLLDTRVKRIFSHTLQMLHGTPYKDDAAFIKANGYVTRWRLVPLDFSKIDDTPIFDVEEVGVATKDMSFDEYVEARKYLFLLDLCHNTQIFRPLQIWLRQRGIANSLWINTLFNTLGAEMPAAAAAVWTSFRDNTVGELWDSEGELVEFYSRPDNYERLLAGDFGGNVLFRNRILMLSQASVEWVDWVVQHTRALVTAQLGMDATIAAELDDLRKLVLGSVSECYDPEALDKAVTFDVHHDLAAWLAAEDVPLAEFRLARPEPLDFTFTDRDKMILRDGFKRYGTDIKGLIKLIQRTGNTPYRYLNEGAVGPTKLKPGEWLGDRGDTVSAAGQ